MAKPLQDITPSTTPAQCGSFVHLYYEKASPGPTPIVNGVDKIPALVIRQVANGPDRHPRLNIVPYGDGNPDGSGNSPICGVGRPKLSVHLFDPLNGEIPDVPSGGHGPQFFGRVWLEHPPASASQAVMEEIVKHWVADPPTKPVAAHDLDEVRKLAAAAPPLIAVDGQSAPASP